MHLTKRVDSSDIYTRNVVRRESPRGRETFPKPLAYDQESCRTLNTVEYHKMSPCVCVCVCVRVRERAVSKSFEANSRKLFQIRYVPNVW